jgi:hypothetical protein
LETNTKKVLAAESKKLYEAVNFDLDVCSEVGFLRVLWRVLGSILSRLWRQYGRILEDKYYLYNKWRFRPIILNKWSIFKGI